MLTSFYFLILPIGSGILSETHDPSVKEKPSLFSPTPKESAYMLIHWQSHQEYLNFLHEAKIHLDSSQRTRIDLEFGAIQKKLRMLNLDLVMEYFLLSIPILSDPLKNRCRSHTPPPAPKTTPWT